MKKVDNNLIIGSLLLNWYKKNRRDLPWRNSRDPYSIWIAEIILQQTRVNQGWEYFLRFVERFPNVQTLANADEEDILKLWQGLGYYSRARNLHAAAKQIMTQFNGKFPKTHADIISLKGVGEYTAAAIASIAYNQPYAVVDGNVFRVLSRLFSIETPINTSAGKKIFTEMAQSILHPQFPGEHNQALMDLGSMVCTPTKPLCTECPLQNLCLAYQQNGTTQFPVKMGKTAIKNRYFHYFHIISNGKTYIRKRNKSDVWKNLYEFPLIETAKQTDFPVLSNLKEFKELFALFPTLKIDKKLQVKHVLSHQHIHTVFYRIEIDSQNMQFLQQNYLEIAENDLHDYPVSRLIHKYLETI